MCYKTRPFPLAEKRDQILNLLLELACPRDILALDIPSANRDGGKAILGKSVTSTPPLANEDE